MNLPSSGAHGAGRARLPSAALLAALLLSSCGGGGGTSGSTPFCANTSYVVQNGSCGVSGTPAPGAATTFTASSELAGVCAAPRPSTVVDPDTGAPYPDRQGTLDDEKRWVRSWIDETYLWYQDVRNLSAATVDASRYATPIDYFNALKSPVTTASGKPLDQFHFTYDTSTWNALSQSGIAVGYGFEVALLDTATSRQAVVAYTDPGTPAVAAGIARGARILAVDGVALASGASAADVATIDAGLFPTVAGPHAFSILDLGASVPRSVTLTASALVKTPVQNVEVLPAPNRNVGYLQFNDHIATSEKLLVDAIVRLKAAGVTDLVLDMRYNGGGFLAIAAELAYMIAGPAATGGKTFERVVFNDRNPFGTTAAQTVTPFLDTTQGYSTTTGQPLPSLGLSRVYVLAGPGTCSASEAVVNGLRGVGVRVELIGATTCGKPYGFLPTDNCGTTYFAIQFKGVNDAGFGDYADGMAPTCRVDDDFGHALGDPAEGLLAVALGHRNTGTCAPGVRASAAKPGSASPTVSFVRPANREMRLYRRP